MSEELRKTGLEVVGDVPWGTHFCQFYQTGQDLLDILVPYFTAGLKSNEFCMWVTSEPLGAEAARLAMAAALPDFDNYLRRGQIEIVPHTDWYLKGGRFDADRVLNDWVRKLDEALAAGYEGLRLTGNTFWLEQKDWRAFTEYEAAVDGVISRYRMLAVCTYSIDRCGFNEILDVIRNHRFALVRREGRWELVENAEHRRAQEELKRLAQFPAQNPNPILRVTPGGEVIYANASARDLLERMGWKESMPVPPSLRAVAGEAEGRDGAVEAEITCDRGRIYWFAAVSPAGESYINLYAMDITERKRAEEDVRKGREWLRVTLTSIGDAVIATDAEKRVTFLNPVASALTGWPSDEALGRPVLEVFRIINEFTREPAEDIFARVLVEQRAVGMANHTALLAKDGRVVPIEDSAAPILGADGGLEGVVLVFQDVTAKRQSQRALRESEQRFRSVLDNSLDVVYRLNLQSGRYEYFSPASSAVYGFSPEEMMAMDPRESLARVHPEDRGALEAALARIAESEKGLVECRWRTKAGEYHWLSTNMLVIRDAAGRLLYRDGTVRDITERRRDEADLRESEEGLKRAQEIAHLGSWDLDLAQNRLTWSDEVYRIFGFAPQEFGATYEAFLDAIHPDDRAAVDAAYSESVREGRDGYEIEHRVVRRDNGEIRFVHEKCEHRRDASGRVVRSIGMVHDITERKNTEALRQALAGQERLRLGAAVEQASDSVAVLDLDGSIRYVNAAFESINRTPRVDAVQCSYFDFLTGDPAAAAIRESVAKGQAWRGPLTRPVPDGRPVELEVTISPVTDPSGKVIGELVTEKDVTQENALQRQVRQSQKMEALGTLAGGITHDFNNILGAIIINTELALLDLEPSHPGRAPLPTVLQAANRGKELVKQIITFSRQREWERKPLEVAPVVKEAMKFLRSTLPKDVAIHEMIAPDSGTVRGDPSQIHQIIVNLCQNAALAMGDKGGDLEIKLEPVEVDIAMVVRHPELKAGPFVRLTVADSGCGMSRELMERIFEPFFTTRGPGGGSGLGLAVVHGIVRNYNGTVTVYSEPGQGSVFSVYLPRLQAEILSAETAQPLQPVRGHERILLVEDEATQRASLARSLTRLGYRVTARAAGRSALTAFRRDPRAFDLVITDQSMPRMSGLELAAALVNVRPGVPIILCTGFSEKVQGETVGQNGIREFVMKPFTLQEISRLIRKALKNEE